MVLEIVYKKENSNNRMVTSAQLQTANDLVSSLGTSRTADRVTNLLGRSDLPPDLRLQVQQAIDDYRSRWAGFIIRREKGVQFVKPKRRKKSG